MTGSVLDFDEIAADDALIEAIRLGADASDVPSDDPAVSLLLACRDGAAAEVEAPEVAEPSLPAPRFLDHRRLLASAVAGCLVVLAGVGTAVAGDPSAAFRFMFDRGVELGSRFGSPAGEENRAQPRIEGLRFADGTHGGTFGQSPLGTTRESDPWAAKSGDGPLGFQTVDSRWSIPGTHSLGTDTMDDRNDARLDATQRSEPSGEVTPYENSPSDVDGDPTDDPTDDASDDDDRSHPSDDTISPESNDSPSPDPTDSESPSPDPTESSDTPSEEPTESEPTESSSTPTSGPTEPEPTESSPTEGLPTEMPPTESLPTETPGPSESTPTQ